MSSVNLDRSTRTLHSLLIHYHHRFRLRLAKWLRLLYSKHWLTVSSRVSFTKTSCLEAPHFYNEVLVPGTFGTSRLNCGIRSAYKPALETVRFDTNTSLLQTPNNPGNSTIQPLSSYRQHGSNTSPTIKRASVEYYRQGLGHRHNSIACYYRCPAHVGA